MSAAVDDVTQVALTLPEHQRAALADALLDSLNVPSNDPGTVDATWTSNIVSRQDERTPRHMQAVTPDQTTKRTVTNPAVKHTGARYPGLLPGGRSLSKDGSVSHRFQLRLDNDTADTLRRRAAAEGKTTAGLLRELVTSAMASTPA